MLILCNWRKEPMLVGGWGDLWSEVISYDWAIKEYFYANDNAKNRLFQE